MNYQIIPLNSDPAQSLQTTVSVDGRNITLKLDIRFNDIAGYWVMTISDPATNTVLVSSIPLILSGNILEQYSYLKIGSAFLVNVSNSSDEMPTMFNMGVDFQIWWGDAV